MRLKPFALLLISSLFLALNSAEINLRNYIEERYRAGERVITLPDGDIYVKFTPCRLGPKIRDLEIRGGKQTRLILRAPTELFYFSGCHNVKVSGFAVDHQPLLFTQGTITKIEGKRYYFRLHDGYPRMGKQFINRHPHFFDRKTRKFKWGNSLSSGDCREVRAINADSGVIEYTAPVNGIQVGDYIVLNYRKGAAFKIDDLAGDIRLEDIIVYNAGFGIMSRRSTGNVTVRRFRIVPGPPPEGATEPRLMATCADAFNFAASRRGPTIENCEVNAIGDDSINLHGSPRKVVALTPDGNPIICLPPVAKKAVELFQPGDTVLVLKPGNYEIRRKTRLNAVRPVKFDDPEVLAKYFPHQKPASLICCALELKDADVQTGDLLDFPAINCPGFEIRNNRFSNHRARGIRLMAGDGIIENNTISHLENSAISIGPEYAYWDESGWVDNVTVRGNRIDSVCLGASAWKGGSYTAGAICTFIRNDPALPVFPGNRNLRIEDNTIRNCPLSGIFLAAAENVLIKGNELVNTAYRNDARTGRQYGIRWAPKPIGFFGSRNIRCENNQIRQEAAPTLYVDNLKGNDANDGSREKPLASIERACKLVQTSGRIEIVNTGTPYSLPYDGPRKPRGLRLLRGGTAEQPLVVEGNGAVISGLAVIPAEAWKREAEGIYSLPFDPMSNLFRRDMSKNYWLPGTQIWFVDGKAAPNLLDRESLEKTPNGFWWNKKERKVLYHLPAGKQLADLKIQLPANYGFYIHRSHTIVRNFTMMFSWNDGFDAAETPKHAMYVNCLAYNSCGQGMSIHDASDVYYEECGAVNCASSAVCNVGQSSGTYQRCVLIDSTFEAAVFLSDDASALFDECLIADPEPAELIWQYGRSKILFNNCTLIGNRKNNLATLSAGTLTFFGCTMRNGTGFISLESRFSTGALSVEKSLLRGFARYYVKLPDQPTARRIRLAGNRYAPTAGHWFRGKPEVPGTSPALTKLQLDRDSKTEAFELTGRKSSENPHAVDRRSLRIGSKLPESVWKIYDRLKQYEATPAGIVKKGAVAR